MDNKNWVEDDGVFSFGCIPSVTKQLPLGIYELEIGKFGFYLKRISDKFIIEGKIYGVENKLIDRIESTYKSLNKNFGILLKGLKGTGKTITSKLICERLNLPVILVNKDFTNLGEFVNSINQDIVLFFDEFEKVYSLNAYESTDEEGELIEEAPKKKNVNSLLTLMDGVFTSEYKRVFLLTTNKVHLPDALLSRPSRIRYIKNFADLDQENIREILLDKLDNKEFIPDIVSFISNLEYITIDIVKTIAEEVNIHDTADRDFLDLLNITKSEDKVSLYQIKGKKEILLTDEFNYNIKGLVKQSGIYIKDEYYRVIDIGKDKQSMTMYKHADVKKVKIDVVIRKATNIHPEMVKFVA